jgi:hypothetical protein
MRATQSTPVIVLTRASSGIGRATAKEFARQGSRLVLAARGLDALQTVAAERGAAGATAHVVPTDSTRSPDVTGIHICDVYPAFVDTPGVSHGANYSGHRLTPAPPPLDARLAAAQDRSAGETSTSDHRDRKRGKSSPLYTDTRSRLARHHNQTFDGLGNSRSAMAYPA